MNPALKQYLADLAKWQVDVAAWAAREQNLALGGAQAESGNNGPPPPPPTRVSLSAED